MTGSSPLARGLPEPAGDSPARRRIIPARAGFTSGLMVSTSPVRDHPRSRGVYSWAAARVSASTGSSPLARGLPPGPARARHHHRIIPARAGFTSPSSPTARTVKDHPRSRGVYEDRTGPGAMPCGSSPLARGLPAPGWRPRGSRRIIPARAGFTGRCPPGVIADPDHPRSRGVYDLHAHGPPAHEGSSPLARGLRRRRPRRGSAGRIIPARAGFTPAASSRSRRRDGSSPLARGLR